MRYEYGEDGVLHYVIEGLSFDDFDKSERVSIWKLSKLVEGARILIFAHNKQLRSQEPSPSVFFLRSNWFKIYPAFYSLLKPGVSVKINARISYMGKTSVCKDTDIVDVLTNELLAVTSTHTVMVSKETRRSTAISSELRDHLTIIPSREKRPMSGPEFPKRPAVYFAHKRTIMTGDSDSNLHLNQAVLIRHCLDCVSMAAEEGQLTGFSTGDIFDTNAEEVWVRYVKEATVGQELTISCWTDSIIKHIIWVEVKREDDLIGQCQITFYPREITRTCTTISKL